jgi:hypothetical protein
MIFPTRQRRTISTFVFVSFIALGACRFALGLSSASGRPEPVLPWHSSAKMKRLFMRETGMLVFSLNGVEFRPRSGPSDRWSFTQIKTFDLTPRGFVLTTYENKGWHRPGDRQYRFRLARPIPPDVAARLADLVGKPVINGDPGLHEASFASIPARHRALTGGTNGVLCFTETGINYVTPHNQSARSWRWADIQTLANPDPYHLLVEGYRETFDFELKEPMPQALFDRLWDAIYGRGLRLSVRREPGKRVARATR